MRKPKKFEFLDITTADVAFAAYGSSLDELFANAALATFEVMVDTKQVEPSVDKKVDVSGHDLNSLMFNWLSELIFLHGSEEMMFSKFYVKVDEKAFALSAVCAGEGMDQKKHELRTEVKAATYHKMEIKKSNGPWRAQVILDI
jgi:SHS2 domain-containing protein